MRGLETCNGLSQAILTVNVAGMSYANVSRMKVSRRDYWCRSALAFTRIELLVLIAILAILAAMIPCASWSAKAKVQRIGCANILKSMGLSFRLWAGDNGEMYPMTVSVTNGGTMELVGNGSIYPHFTAMSNELATPKMLVCPSDNRRQPATNFPSLRDTNVSYFLCLNATSSDPQTWLIGDRNITNGFAPIRGVLTVPTNMPVGWTEKMHENAGNICLADGSVQQPSSRKLNEFLRSVTNSPLRLAIPQ